MNSTDRVLAILTLFTTDRRVWTADMIARKFDVSVSQAYRYCKSLVQAGLLDPIAPAGFILGPAFIEFERLLRLSDPLISAARPVMLGLSGHVPEGATILISKLYHARVMCLDQVVGRSSHAAISFERGRPMPLLWGATSKAILAHVSKKELARIYKVEAFQGETAGPDGALREKLPLASLKVELAEIRRLGYCIARGEVDRGRVGIAAPIFDDKGAIIGSLTTAITDAVADRRTVRRLASLMVASAREVEDSMTDQIEADAGAMGTDQVSTGPDGKVSAGRRAG